MGYLIENIFPKPIYTTIIDNIDEMQEEYESNSFDFFSTQDSWGKTHKITSPTFGKNIIEEKNLVVAKKVIHKHLQNYCFELGFVFTDYEIKESWVTQYENGEYAQVHHHGDSHISGCYYYQTNGTDGDIFFLDASNSTNNACYGNFSGTWTHKPQVGKLLLFPGFLLHGVTTNTTNHIRRSLSFNIKFKI